MPSCLTQSGRERLRSTSGSVTATGGRESGEISVWLSVSPLPPQPTHFSLMQFDEHYDQEDLQEEFDDTCIFRVGQSPLDLSKMCV